MREMDSLGLWICRFQAKLFEKSIDQLDCSSKVFIRRFMNSNLVKRFDNHGIPFEATDIDNCFYELEEEYGASDYGKDKFSNEEMYWIGYIYRYWSYIYEDSSKKVYKIAKPDFLRSVYKPYHTLDPQYAIERIIEDIGLEEIRAMDDIAYGVKAMRKVRNRHQS